MSKIKPQDLEKIRETMARTMNLRDGDAQAKITVHMGTCGIAAGARKIMSTLLALVEDKNARDIVVTTSGCAGLCSREPMMTVELKEQAPVKYVHVLSGKVVKEYALAVGSERVG
jgi:NADP-reducing hydrogenase subunit HndB